MKNILFILLNFGILISQTTSEIKQAKEFIKRTGMKESEVINAAKSRGFSEKKIQKALKENKQKSQQKRQDTGQKNSELKPEISVLDDNSISVSVDESTEDLTDQSFEDSYVSTEQRKFNNILPYFGYDIFKRDPNLFQESSSGAFSTNYLIGPGDEIIVMLWGETQFRQVFSVDREGFVFIPEIGQVFVNGLNLKLLELKLLKVFSQSYASLNPRDQKPSTFIDISLGKLRPLRIHVLGEVKQPGAYTVSPGATLFSALYYFNGPTKLGSLREIQLIRGDKHVASIDFYDYLLTGKKIEDINLQVDDVIFIPKRLKTVQIDGEINRRGIYELKKSEDLSTLIKIAGGLKKTAYLKRAQIDRIIPFDDRDSVGMDRIYLDINLEESNKLDEGAILQDDDKIQIFSIQDLRQNVVEIRGAVSRPGMYDLGDSLSIKQLIDKADGLLGDAYLERIDIIRTQPNLKEELIKVDILELMSGNLKNDFMLQGLDRIRIYGMNEMVSKSFATISGYVKNPGSYLIRDNMKIYDLIFAAGGFLDERFKERAILDNSDLFRFDDNKITRKIIKVNLIDILENPNSSENFIIENGDILTIYEKSIELGDYPIWIEGLIRNNGKYVFKKDMTLKSLIFEAGGIQNNRNKYKVEVARTPKNSLEQNSVELISFNVELNFIKDNSFKKLNIIDIDDFKLQEEDMVFIRKHPYLSKKDIIKIAGEVSYPGDYVITSENENISDIIKRAGGVTPNAYLDASEYTRNGQKIYLTLKKLLENPKSSSSLKIKDGDVLFIKSHPRAISIFGEVNKTGLHSFQENKRLKYYIKKSGGFTTNANKKSIWIEYPNGNSKKYNRFSLLSPKILDGSIIQVGKKKEKEDFDVTEFAKEVTSIIANFAQVAYLLVIASSS